MMQQLLIFLSYLLCFQATVICPDNCSDCDTSGKICLACSQNYQLTLNNNCVRSTVNYCSLYISTEECLRCQPTYKLRGNTCIKQYSGCTSQQTINECQSCLFGLFFQNKICVGVLNCKKYQSSTSKRWTCLECDEYFTLKDNICWTNSSTCSSAEQQFGTCSFCMSGYDLVGYKCVSNYLSNTNCYVYDEKGQCVFCKTGYLLYFSNCYTRSQVQSLGLLTNSSNYGSNSISFSNSSLPNSSLSSFPNNYSENEKLNSAVVNLNASATKSTNSSNIVDSIINMNVINTNVIPNLSKNSNISTILPPSSINQSISQSIQNLLACRSFNNKTCQQCYSGYYLDRSFNCQQINPLCKIFNFLTLNCDECYKGYASVGNGKCAVIQLKSDLNCQQFDDNNAKLCLLCYNGYYLNSVSGLCLVKNPVCKTIESSSGNCSSCYPGYSLSAGACQISSSANAYDPFCTVLQNDQCQNCANGYFLNQSSGICQVLNTNCLESNVSDGSCVECLEGYSLINSSCIITIVNCVKYGSNGCIFCNLGFFVKLGICFQNDVTCAKYDISNGKCMSCVDTYYLVDQTCVFPALGFDQLCVKYVNSYCTQCSNHSFLNNYRCQAIDPNCIAFNSQLKRCQQCQGNLKPSGLKCA